MREIAAKMASRKVPFRFIFLFFTALFYFFFSLLGVGGVHGPVEIQLRPARGLPQPLRGGVYRL